MKAKCPSEFNSIYEHEHKSVTCDYANVIEYTYVTYMPVYKNIIKLKRLFPYKTERVNFRN